MSDKLPMLEIRGWGFMKTRITIFVWVLWNLITPISILSAGEKNKEKSVNEFVPNYDFVIPKDFTSEPTDITIGIINPRFLTQEDWVKVSPFTEFKNSMINDFQEMIVARGYRIKGPFSTYDEMTYGDKKSCDMIIVPEIDVNIQVVNLKKKKKTRFKDSSKNRKRYRYTGQINLSGKVTITMVESLTKEKVWVKSIQLENKLSDNFRFYKKFGVKEKVPNTVSLEDQPVKNAFGPVTNELYQEAMKTMFTYLEPEEMLQVKILTDELKSKKVF